MQSSITGHTKTFALIGTPVGHSGSPAMYNYCFQKLGIDSVYVALDVTLDKLEAAMGGIKAMGFSGINITMPCKSEVMKYMDEISPAAKLMNSCNVAVNENGHWVGHNTDGLGYVENLKAHGIDVAGKTITLLGAGGAGTAIAVQCALSGAKEIFIYNMKDAFFPRAEDMAKKIGEAVPACKISVYDLSDAAMLKQCANVSQILANATRAGMSPDVDTLPIPSTDILNSSLIVTETVYNPRETRLLREAAALGYRTVDGTGMLIHQGAAALKLFTGADMPVDEVHALIFGK